MNSEPVVVEQTVDASPDTVWKAITDQDQMRQWFFEPMTRFEPVVGFETRFVVRVGEQDYPHQWKITEVVPMSKIVYDWRYGGFPGASTVTWELSKSGAGTTLKLTHQGIETFPQDNPIFSREATQGGWDYFICQSLPAFLKNLTA